MTPAPSPPDNTGTPPRPSNVAGPAGVVGKPAKEATLTPPVARAF